MAIQDIRHRTKRTNGTRALTAVTTIVRHHSATTSGNFDSFWRHWNGTLGWGTGGYHEIILRDGTVQLCYDPNEITNGVGGQNTYTYHISLVGNGSFTAAQEKAWDERVAVNMKRLNIKVANVKGHGEMPGASTSCPGINMNIVRSRISNGGSIANPPTTTFKLGDRILRNASPMMRGDDVRELQEAIGVTADGIFGPATEKALKDYQKTNKLQVDGVCGPETVRFIKANKAKPSNPGNMTTTSIVTYLNSIGEDSGMPNRRKLASENGISGYTGTAAQNTLLLSILRDGELPPSPPKPAPSAPKGNMTTDSIVTYLDSIKVDSSYQNRARLASQHKISNYTGTAAQNTRLLNAMRGGSSSNTSSNTSSGSLPNRTIRVQSPFVRGADVTRIQRALVKANFYPNIRLENNGVDGVYGNDTADAVRRFQSMNGLKADGVYGPATRGKLQKYA